MAIDKCYFNQVEKLFLHLYIAYNCFIGICTFFIHFSFYYC